MNNLFELARGGLGRGGRAAFAVAAGLALAASPAAAGPLTGASVTASFISGAAFWDILPTAAQAIPTGYALGSGGFPTLAMSIDVDGLVSLTPHPQSCSSGCGYNMSGATFEFTLLPAALLGLQVIDAAPNLGITATWIDADSFRISVGEGGGATNAVIFQAQLEFAEVPEPAALSILGVAVAALGVARRRRPV